MCNLGEMIAEEAAAAAVLKRDKEMIQKQLKKGWTPERIHEDTEYPLDLILEVQEEMLTDTNA